MKEVIQKLLYPTKDIVRDHYGLYYRGERGVQTKENGKTALNLSQFTYADFMTLFNGVSLAKWKKYTGMRSLTLVLTLQGKGVIRLVGSHLHLNLPTKEFYGEFPFDFAQPQQLEICFPEMDETFAGFEIETKSPVTIEQGAFLGEFDSEREVNLAIATTTCKKEKYITANVRSIRDELLGSDRLISSHLTIHVVDNGRTLKREDFPESERIFLHSNRNVGGSGGYARGMIECLHQEMPATHVLLMDDDVVIETESINKTFVLLRHLKDEYQKHFISGAMMTMENPVLQWEDLGYVQKNGYFESVKPKLNQNGLYENLKNEQTYRENHTYAAWWFCCVPAETIRENGLPMPFFIRGDDVEYSLRCNPGFITMNGICIWHMGFGGKYNVTMDEYQVNRNMLINKASLPCLADVDPMFKAVMEFRYHMLRFDYGEAEIALRGIEDYLKGPSVIEKDRGEQIVKENNTFKPVMVPLSKLGHPERGKMDLYCGRDLRPSEEWLFGVTYNGQLFYNGPFRREPMTVPYNDPLTYGRQAFRTRLYAVDLENQTGYVLERNEKRFLELFRRYRKAMDLYRKDNDRIAAAYRKKKKEFVTEKFWRSYLGLQAAGSIAGEGSDFAKGKRSGN